MSEDNIGKRQYPILNKEARQDELTTIKSFKNDRRVVHNRPLTRPISYSHRTGVRYGIKYSDFSIDPGEEGYDDIREMTKRKADVRQKLGIAREHGMKDSLTGLYNQAYFFDEMSKQFSLWHRGSNNILGITIIDIRDFKNINDVFGHFGGDNALRNIAKKVQKVIRAADSACRRGGDEFGLVFPNVDPVGSKQPHLALIDGLAIANLRILDNIRNQIKFRKSTGEYTTLSIDIGSTCAFDNDSSESLERRADQAMYYAKLRKVSDMGKIVVAYQKEGKEVFELASWNADKTGVIYESLPNI